MFINWLYYERDGGNEEGMFNSPHYAAKHSQSAASIRLAAIVRWSTLFPATATLPLPTDKKWQYTYYVVIILTSNTISALATSFGPAGLAIGDISRTLPAAVWRTLSSPSPGKTKMILISTEMVSGFE